MADFEKTAYEDRIFGFDFGAKMLRSAKLVSIEAVVIARQSGVDVEPLTESERAVSNKRAQAKFSGGDAGASYTITVKVTDSDGQKLEGEAMLDVVEL
ncbi:hypothetical protein FRZ44_37930 [Hypericibacter terrae]|uniref:Phage tail protein n=1 Tax=Hypericibacter terrae TaxID=2602015 RepID=A0A5J6MUH3_9PROT|nr:hypothetical protein [Hypericibacter terrae]QEX18486.1 hypothetical protein FRZ44_37930 [Hypericibacter terrae]